MTKHVARYSIQFGLSGCYMPDSHYGAFEVTSRRDLATLIREAIASYDMPASAFAQANIRNLWRFIARNGSSVAHFSIRHGAHEIAFSGLTESEYAEAAESED